MAYSKQTWTDDVSAVTGARMTHIEQGIYDNSLATDKINPSGTATTIAEIEEGQITDVIGIKSLKLKGQTSQETTQGNNLLNIYARHPAGYTETVSGVTITYNDDGSISANGKATADINYFLASKAINGDDVFNGTHYLSGCSDGSATTFYLQFWADTVGTYQQTTTEVTTNKTAGVNWNITIGIKNGVTINKSFYPMMCATSGKSFEKFSGGKASPNPDFPQDVNNVSGYNVVGISNKNLLKLKNENKVVSGTTIKISDTGTIELSGTSSEGIQYIQIPENFYLNAGTYIIKTTVTGTSTKPQAFVLYNGSTVLSNITYNVGGNNATFTLSERTQITKITFWVSSGTVNTNFKAQIQLEKGSSATSFVAHQGNNFEINLGKNLFNKENIIEGKRLSNDPQNQLAVAEGYYTSSFIKVNSNTTYTKNSPLADAFHRFAFYSSNSESGYLSISNANTIVTPSECEYVRFSGQINELDTTQLEKNAIATSFADYFPPIEICKIGTYEDYIFKKDGKWWKHKEVRRQTFNGSETWTTRTASTGAQLYETDVTGYFSTQSISIGYSNQYISLIYLTDDNTFRIMNGNKLAIHNDTIGSVDNFKTFLSSNNLITYYPLATPIEEEITYAPLIRQLDELYNSGLYDVTNISQDNSSEAFILDLEACKNNINGIVEYIRR